MKRQTFLILNLCVIIGFSAKAEGVAMSELLRDPESCTSIMVGKKASADGSVITSHTCDGNYRTWMNLVSAKTYEKDTVVGIYDGLMHTEFVEDKSKWRLKGTIPQVRATYRFLNTSYPCMNEKQLAIGETTITGKKELVNKNGMFMIEELQRIVLERCTTARDAIRLMGELILKYGYADSGECLTIADTKEVWHFEVFGEGPDKVGGVWAAIRIPDDHVGVSANIPRISFVDVKDKENCMASANVFDVAKKLGYWDGKEPFSFWKAYSDKDKAFNIREFFILRALAPSLAWDFDAKELPLTIKPEKQISVTDVMALLRETYEGTQWDMTQNLKVEVKKKDSEETEIITSPHANPWMLPDMVAMLNGIKDSTVTSYRTVSVARCSYSVVIQLRDWLPDAVGGVSWLSFDNPGQSPRMPVFCGTTELPACFYVCGQHRYQEDAVIWRYREANRLATVRWGHTRDKIHEAVAYFEHKGQAELPFVEAQYQRIKNEKNEEAANAYLTGYTKDFAGATLLRWEELKAEFWKMYVRGF